MDIRLSELERWLLDHEGKVAHDLGHSGVVPILDYGDLPADRDLVRALAAHLDVPEEEVVVTCGASEASFLAALAVCERGDVVAVEEPSYPPLAQGPALAGARVVRFPRRREDGFAAPVAPVADARLTTYSSPHNPSGRRVPADVVARTAEATGGWVLADEVFREIADDTPPTLRRAHPRALAVGSLTKAHGFPGLRIGWLLAPPEIARRALAAKNVITVSAGILDQRLAERALAMGLPARAARIRRENLPLVREAMRRAKLDWVEPEAGVSCLVRVAGDDRALAQRLFARGILVTPGSALGIPGMLRVGFGGPSDGVRAALEAFVAAMRDGSEPS